MGKSGRFAPVIRMEITSNFVQSCLFFFTNKHQFLVKNPAVYWLHGRCRKQKSYSFVLGFVWEKSQRMVPDFCQLWWPGCFVSLHNLATKPAKNDRGRRLLEARSGELATGGAAASGERLFQWCNTRTRPPAGAGYIA